MRYSWWLTLGGTSWATATFAGIVNSAGHFFKSSAAELSTIYAGIGNKKTLEISRRGIAVNTLVGVQRLTLNGIIVKAFGIAWASLVNKR